MELRTGHQPHRCDRPCRGRPSALGLAQPTTSLARPSPFLPVRPDATNETRILLRVLFLFRAAPSRGSGRGLQVAASTGRVASGVGTSSRRIATIAASTLPEAPSL